MADVEALCKRVIVIHHGQLLFDGKLSALGSEFAAHKTVTIEFADGDAVRHDVLARIASAAPASEVVTTTESSISVRVPRNDVPRVATLALDALEVLDLSIEDPPIEDIIEQVFNAERA